MEEVGAENPDLHKRQTEPPPQHRKALQSGSLLLKVLHYTAAEIANQP